MQKMHITDARESICSKMLKYPKIDQIHFRFFSIFHSVRILCPVSVCPDSVCLDSVRCQDSVRIFRKKAFRCLSVRTLSVSILSAVRVLSGFLKKTLSAVCLSGRTRTRQSCPDFRCPCPPTSAQTGNRTRAAWVKARNPNP